MRTTMKIVSNFYIYLERRHRLESFRLLYVPIFQLIPYHIIYTQLDEIIILIQDNLRVSNYSVNLSTFIYVY